MELNTTGGIDLRTRRRGCPTTQRVPLTPPARHANTTESNICGLTSEVVTVFVIPFGNTVFHDRVTQPRTATGAAGSIASPNYRRLDTCQSNRLCTPTAVGAESFGFTADERDDYASRPSPGCGQYGGTDYGRLPAGCYILHQMNQHAFDVLRSPPIFLSALAYGAIIHPANDGNSNIAVSRHRPPARLTSCNRVSNLSLVF
jgi:hypothetical protein